MKEKLFADAASVLVRTKTAFPDKVTPAKAQLLLEVAEILGMARQVSQAADPATVRGWRKYWKEVAEVQVTLISITQGGNPDTKAVSLAAQLCVRIFHTIHAR